VPDNPDVEQTVRPARRNGGRVLDRSPGLEIRRQSTAEQVAAAIRSAILEGKMAPGSPLREIPLAEELGVSRNSVREAIRILEGEHLVRYQMNRGTEVTGFSDEEIDDLFAAREILELAGLRALQTLPSKERAAALEPFVAAIETANANGDTDAAAQADRAFHTALVAAAGNEHLMRWYEGLRGELALALALAERRRGDLGRAETERSRELNDHRWLAKAIQGPEDVGIRRLKEHLAYGAAELHRLRKLLA
jgi:DNA-binding GntR family transcriptional regulator